MHQQLNHLKNKILGREKKTSLLTDIIDLARELHCLPDIIGRDYEVLDKNGDIIYTIRQKPMKVKQLNVLFDKLCELRKRDKDNVPNVKSVGKRGGR